MTEETRTGKNFSRSKRRQEIERTHYHCEACGRFHEKLYVHHDPPIILGGDKNSRPWVLDSDCHKVADKLALEHGISLRDVAHVNGRRPLSGYASVLDKGGFRKVVERVAEKVGSRRKAG